MNKKSSAISFSILIMLIVLGVLLGFTSYYIDQAAIKPIVLMKDSEVNMKCFLVLLRNTKGYINIGEVAPSDTYRSKLLNTYSISYSYSSFEPSSTLNTLGYSGIFMGNEEEFRNLISNVLSEFKIQCYMRSYGPVQKGFIAIYK
jgi:hypothetical protein